MIEVKITNKEGKVVIRRPVKALPAVPLASPETPQVYYSSPPKHKQEISLKGRINHRRAMLKKKYI